MTGSATPGPRNDRGDAPPASAGHATPGRMLGAVLGLTGAVLATAALSGWPAKAASVLEHQLPTSGAVVPAEVANWWHELELRRWLLGAGGALIVLGFLVLALSPRVVAAVRARSAASGPDHASRSTTADWLVPIAGCVVIFARFLPTLAHGFFRYDDFELIAVANGGDVWNTLWQPHGDHFLPLTRLLFLGAVRWCGVAPLPYNLALLAAFAVVLVAACRLLAQLGASRGAQAVFATLFIGWSPWAEMLAGYYVLGTYLLIAALSLFAIRRYLRWRENGAGGSMLAFATAAAVAPLIDVSGWYVIGACALLALTQPRHATPGSQGNERRRIAVAFVVAAAVPLAITWWAYAVQHPGLFLSMGGAEPRSATHVAADLGYLLGAGVAGSMALPFVYAQLPGPLLLALVGLAIGAAGGFFVAAFRAADPARRRTLLTLLGIAAGIGVMVVLGRPSQGTLAVRWAAKHVGPVYVWFCVAISVAWDALWRARPELARGRFAEASILGLLAFVAVQWSVGRLGLAVAFPPFGYPAEIRDARLRRAGVEALWNLATRLRDGTARPHTVPTVDGPAIHARCRSLFTYNLSHYLPFCGPAGAELDLVRNSAMQRWRTSAVRTVPSLRGAIPEETRDRLAHDPELRAYYFGTVELSVSPTPLAPARTVRMPTSAAAPADHQPDGSWVVESDGRTELVVEPGTWDPESRSRLLLALTWSGRTVGDARLDVAFDSDLLHDRSRATVTVPAKAGLAGETDLLQLPAFALSRAVGGLRITLATPGRYRIARLELAP